MIEYIDSIHTYLYDGVIIPSVSQILAKLFPDKYKGIPEDILERKAEYGTKIHKAIELYEKNLYKGKDKAFEIAKVGLSIIQIEALGQYVKLKERYNIEVIEQEKIICYKGLYAGRFDMIAKVNGELCLLDIKTIAEYDEEYLSWQLSMYELGYGKMFDKLYAIWLPKKRIGKLKSVIRKSKEEIEKVIEREKGEKNV